MLILLSAGGHALTALLFAGLALWQGLRGRARMLALACLLTAGWAALAASLYPTDLAASAAETVRNLGWLAWMAGFLRAEEEAERRASLTLLYGVVAGVALLGELTSVAAGVLALGSRLETAAISAEMLLGMSFSTGALVLVHNLYTQATHETRAGLRLPMLALATLWAWDLNLYTVGYLMRGWPDELLALRGLLAVAAAVLIGWGTLRARGLPMRLSRTATFHSLSLAAIGLYLAAMLVSSRLVEVTGGDHALLTQLTVVAATVIGLLLLPSTRVRGWLAVMFAKHLFQHRYDYRAEWLRFSDTLGAGAEPLPIRVVRACAEITGSGAGLLLKPDEAGRLVADAAWNWPDAPILPADPDPRLEADGFILDLDDPREAGHAGFPADAWALAPLIHSGRLIGGVLLGRPAGGRRLDWEDRDLLRAAGRQVASYLAEARGQEALAESRRFDEFNQRFAFILHDVKNLVSQLDLLARNAERHADKPGFRADMVATLQSSTRRLNDLLARLAPHQARRAEPPTAVALDALVAATVRPLGSRVRVEVATPVAAVADPARLEQAIGHLVQNGLDASAPDAPVLVRISRRGVQAAIEIVDQGTGMSPEFVRDELFRPFASTKPAGFGIGAFEARSLVAAMSGRVEVESRVGEGSRFTLLLPLATAVPDERRAA